MQLDFIIVAPAYSHRSGGIMVLHELCTTINTLGHRAGILFITAGSQDNQNFKFAFSSETSLLDPNGIYHDYFSQKNSDDVANYIRNTLVIYPDIVRGNPLGAKHYATYVLGFPKFQIESDYVISYSKEYTQEFDCILHKPFISEFMNNKNTLHWSQRSLGLTYIGKGMAFGECFTVKDTVLIERDWPRSKQQLAALLRQCKYFFTWDCLSATNTDAILCGAVPIFMQHKQLSRNEINSLEYGPMPNIEYIHNVDIRYTPKNVDLIDIDIKNMVTKMQVLLDSWPTQVDAFIKSICTKLHL